MGGLSIWHWLIVLAVVLILFGGGNKMSSLMGDFAKGIKSFKRNMADDESMEAGEARPSGSIAAPPVQPTPGYPNSVQSVPVQSVPVQPVPVPPRADTGAAPRETAPHG